MTRKFGANIDCFEQDFFKVGVRDANGLFCFGILFRFFGSLSVKGCALLPKILKH